MKWFSVPFFLCVWVVSLISCNDQPLAPISLVEDLHLPKKSLLIKKVLPAAERST